ncbi:FAD binding domain-containing protein [Cryptosporangium sp. NPDC048952]|uniref:FAD binding domain-containing protein n=1 Tax=Cryptosporangium sp. NPDC048952 TaxID=3363961 RepID=UPI003718DBAD
MKPAAFDYHAPETAAEAVGLLGELGEDAKVIAGGQSLVPMLAFRLAFVEHLVDLRKLGELKRIEVGADTVRIGAGVTQSAIQRSAEVAEHVPLLTAATPLIGHPAIRNRGTIGGSIAHADASAEYPAVALALGARIETTQRMIPATEFFTGLWSTVLAPDELVTGVTFPRRRPREGFAIEEFARRAGDFALAGAAVAVELDEEHRISRCAIGLFGLAPTPVRATATEAALVGTTPNAATGRDAVNELPSVRSDQHGSSAYRKRVGAAMITRALHRATKEASSE